MTEKKDNKEDFDFDRLKKETESMTEEDVSKLMEHFIINFPIEHYAEAMNNIFKMFEKVNPEQFKK